MNYVFLPIPRRVRQAETTFPVSVLMQCRTVWDAALKPEEYRLEIGADGVRITAADSAGEFYAKCTLAQIRKQSREFVPGMTIEDWSEFQLRGISLDVSRDRIPTMATLKAWIDRFASWKLNHLRLYCEHVFAYKNHAEVWRDATPFTAEEMRELDDYCKARFIELVPVQESFGHMLRWLCHDRYRPLAECPQGWPTPFSMKDTDPFSLCPTDPESVKFVAGLWDELLPCFRSRLIEACCDETSDIGKGRSQAAVEKFGVGRVYLDFIRQLNALAEARGHRLIIATDVVFQHPELVAEIPRNVLLNDWGYRPDYDFDAHARKLQEYGFTFFLQTSNSAYSSFLGRTPRWHENIRKAAFAAQKYHALGIANSEWGDLGHWSDPLFTIPGDAYLAAMAWSPADNEAIDLGAALNSLYFGEGSGVADLLLDCGFLYTFTCEGGNDSDALYLAQQYKRQELGAEEMGAIAPNTLWNTEYALDRMESRLARLVAIAPRDRRAIGSAIRWMRFACKALKKRLDAHVTRAEQLPAPMRAELGQEFDAIAAELVALRDDGLFRTGGREAALFWLKRYKENLTGEG